MVDRAQVFHVVHPFAFRFPLLFIFVNDARARLDVVNLESALNRLVAQSAQPVLTTQHRHAQGAKGPPALLLAAEHAAQNGSKHAITRRRSHIYFRPWKLCIRFETIQPLPSSLFGNLQKQRGVHSKVCMPRKKRGLVCILFIMHHVKHRHNPLVWVP